MEKIDDVAYFQKVNMILESTSERSLCNALPTMVWLSDNRAKLVYCNNECTSFTGLEMDELKDVGFLGSVHPNDISEFQNMAVKALQTKCPASCELRIKRNDGEYIWHLLRCQLCFE